ncbi:hypothetical protein EVAR_11925_1 [Eumeta japonica]|uniref:Uncharacterized protein n=1 Tax=Eumeta variegata TaxID=151549 RepID=A0A4C1U7V1_EUMVA|nr:hypothetical protein EVAR_11925_1 [Eumeta japonica]
MQVGLPGVRIKPDMGFLIACPAKIYGVRLVRFYISCERTTVRNSLPDVRGGEGPQRQRRRRVSASTADGGAPGNRSGARRDRCAPPSAPSLQPRVPDRSYFFLPRRRRRPNSASFNILIRSAVLCLVMRREPSHG